MCRSGDAVSAPVEAVTVDGYGTLVRLDDPVPALQRALAGVGVAAKTEAVAGAFAAEVAHYRPRSHHGRDERSLHALRLECVSVFLDDLGLRLTPSSFVDAFMGALEFTLVPGAQNALEELRSLGLRLACAANWDVGLHAELDRLGVSKHFEIVLTSADVGAPKPAPVIFERALASLGVAAHAAVHIGDEALDAEGAANAGMRFEPTPLHTLPGRLEGLVAS